MPIADDLASTSMTMSFGIALIAAFLGLQQWYERQARESDLSDRDRHYFWQDVRRGIGVAVMLMLAAGLSIGASSAELTGLVRADEPADAPLPEITPKELAARLRAAWASYDKGLLEITFDTTANTNWRFMMNQGEAADQEPILVQFPGRARYLGDGRRWRVEYDSMIPTSLSKQLNPHRWTSGFDGQQLYGWDIMRNIATFGEAAWGAELWKPRHRFWHSGESFAEALEKPPSEGSTLAIGQRTVYGVRCYVVERAYPKQETRTQEVVSPRQGYLLLRTTWFRKGRPNYIQSLHDVREVAPGIWAPGRIVEESRTVRNDGAEQLDRRTEMRIATFEPNKTFAADSFAFEPPYGVDVTDRRLGYSYHNDPWWPEAGKLLRERFDWPKKAGAKDVPVISTETNRLSDEMVKAVSNALPGWIEAAPSNGAIRVRLVDGQGRPIAGAKVTGTLKMTLLIFADPGGYQPVRYRRRFDFHSGPDGRFEMTGLTKGIYELKAEAPGRAWRGRDVPIGPDLRPAEVDITLDQGDAISGVVRDPQGRPIAGATVHPVQWHHHREPNGGEVFTTPSGADPVQADASGRYRLGPLRHGRYTLEVTAPGFERRALETVPAGTTDADATLERTSSP